MSKTSFIISGARFFLTLNTYISSFWKLQSWMSKEPSIPRSLLKVESWPWCTILKAPSWMGFVWTFDFWLWNIQINGVQEKRDVRKVFWWFFFVFFGFFCSKFNDHTIVGKILFLTCLLTEKFYTGFKCQLVIHFDLQKFKHLQNLL